MKLKHFFLSLVAIVLLASCEKDAAVTGIAFNKSTSTLTKVDQKDTITAVIAPADANVTIIWASSNDAIVKVEGSGKTAVITAVGSGKADVVATAGAFSAKCAVTVTIGGGSTGDGAGTEAKPYSVTEAIAFFESQASLPNSVWVSGYIVGGVVYDPKTPGGTDYATTAIDGPEDVVFGANVRNTSVLVALSKDETDYKKCVIVNLPSGNIRNVVNLKDNASNLKKMLTVKGNLARYFAVPGVLDLMDFKLEGYVPPVIPTTPTYTTKFLDETLLTQASYDKFTAVSVDGAELWKFDSRYGAVMSGYANSASHKNEDWFVSPKIDLTGQTNVKMSFDHARGPAGSITVGIQEGWYKVYATANYVDVATSTWVEITGVYHGTGAWGFVTSGGLTIPASAISANTRIAFKYISSDAASATWEVKNLVVGK